MSFPLALHDHGPYGLDPLRAPVPAWGSAGSSSSSSSSSSCSSSSTRSARPRSPNATTTTPTTTESAGMATCSSSSRQQQLQQQQQQQQDYGDFGDDRGWPQHQYQHQHAGAAAGGEEVDDAYDAAKESPLVDTLVEGAVVLLIAALINLTFWGIVRFGIAHPLLPHGEVA